MHEIAHAIGFYHEHQRPDRGDFVTATHPNFAPLELDDFTIVDLNLQMRKLAPGLWAELTVHNALDERKVMIESRTFQPSGVPHDERQILFGLRYRR